MDEARDDGFHPSFLASGGHVQTLLGFWHRRALRWTLPVEDLIVEAGDDIRILLRASWQPGPRESRPTLLTIHGLGGWDEASYGLATGAYAYGMGWHVLRMNMRGAGDSARICPRLYNAGRETKPRTIREWDETITAPYGGYASADEYYARSSAGPYVERLDRRVL